MIYVIHGDNIQASRAAFHRKKTEKPYDEIREISGKTLDTTILTQALESSSLFGGTHAVLIERLLTTIGRKTKQAEGILGVLSRSGIDIDILLWEDKEIPKTLLSKLGKNMQSILHTTPPIIFTFLDSLRPKDAIRILALFRQTTKVDAPELLFSMIIKRVRHLAMIKDSASPEGMSPWQLARLTNQSVYFTMDQLMLFERSLLDIDYSIKSGSTPVSLQMHLELLFADL